MHELAQESYGGDCRSYSEDNNFAFKNKWYTKGEVTKKRNDFSRDKDRILFSRAFRRLEHKTQVYPPDVGDHYRTRLTHTLEVSQVARSISKYLKMNESLVEAISMGHDLGHTPFGHQGERVLDEILTGEEKLNGRLKGLDHGGFKHNFHTLRIVTKLEQKAMGFDGLNLTWQTLEGMLKHTKTCRHKRICAKDGICEMKCLPGNYKIENFVEDEKLIKKLYLNYKFSVTIEGQISQISDEIAQRQHDLDDGLRDKSLGISNEKLCNDLITICENIEKKGIKDGINLLKELKTKFKTYKKLFSNIGYESCLKIFGQVSPELYANKEVFDLKVKMYLREIFVRDVIEYFILDVVDKSLKELDNLNESDVEIIESDKIIKKEVIKFSEAAEVFNNDVEKLINSKILNSYAVNRFDGKAIYIIKQLFKAYYINPRQMSPQMLKSLTTELSKSFKDYDLKIKDNDKEYTLSEINLATSEPNAVKCLLNFLKLNINCQFKNISNSETYTMVSFEEYLSNNKFLNGGVWHEDSENDHGYICEIESRGTKCPDNQWLYEMLVKNNRTYVSFICDYIAGMTDNFAKEEYKKIYQV